MTAVRVSSEQVDRFRALVGDRLGLHMADSDLNSVTAVLKARLAAEKLAPDAYLDRLACAETTLTDLCPIAEALAVHETYFFRNAEHIDVLVNVAVPAWERRAAGQRPLRILSAGCATGEEAYTIAIALRERIADYGPAWFDIRAVDLVPAAIGRARRARYSPWSLRDAPPGLAARWFRRSGREFVLEDEIRGMVSFGVCNLAGNEPMVWPPAGYDVVFCRNVLMYFTPRQAAALVGRISRALIPGGHLFLGYAETLRGLSQDFHLRHTHGAFYYERKDPAAIAASRPQARSRASSGAPARPSADAGTSWFESIRLASERVEVLARRAVPAGRGIEPAGVDDDLAAVCVLLERERFAEALEAVTRLPEPLADRPDVLLLRAVLLAHNTRLAEAERTSLELLGADGSNAGAHYVLALCREGLGDFDGAVECNETAARLDPAFSMPRLRLGLLARKRDRQDAARRELARALVLLESEDDLRLLLFGGGFGRDALLTLCRSELEAAEARHERR